MDKPAEARRQAPDLGSLTFLLEPDSADRRRTRIGLGIAVMAHVVLFVVNWPTIARSAPEPPPQPVRVLVLQPYHPAPPQPPPPAASDARVPEDTVPLVSLPQAEVPAREPVIIRDNPPVPPGEYQPEEPPAEIFPPPPASPTRPVVALVGVDVQPPALVHEVEPRYTEPARRAHLEGAVILSLTIGRSGRVEEIEVLRGLALGLTEAAVTAARQWVFEPSTVRGEPVRVQYILTVRFSLS